MAAALVVGALALAACGSADDHGRGHGVVRGISPDRSSVTLDHGDIPGVMGAMTMDFAVADPSILEGIDVGDEVDFEVTLQAGTYAVTELSEANP
jgi:Cu(I)/Ag(I) efflux system protein CusF